MNVTKRGVQHLRILLIHGARAVVHTYMRQNNLFNKWVGDLKERRGYNKATVAVANKMQEKFGQFCSMAMSIGCRYK